MQSHNILIADNTSFSPSIHLSQSDSVINLDGGAITSGLTEFLSSSQLPSGTGINLVLDQNFIRYQYFSFPLMSMRKIRQVLQFELDDTLLKGSDNYVYTSVSRSSKKTGITEAGVYIIEKQLLDELISVFKLFNLELRWITSLENLSDLAIHDRGQDPGSSILVELAGNLNSARFFTYRNGFLTGISALSTIRETADDEESAIDHFINQLNQKINAIRLAEPGLSEIISSGNNETQIGIIEQQFVAQAESLDSQQLEGSQQDVGAIRPNHPRRINLIQSNILILQELKKYTRSLVISAVIVLCSLTFYVSAVAYRGHYDHLTIQALEKRMAEAVARHLPKGTSKSNALYLLKERIQEIEQDNEKNRNFKRRHYQVARTLTDLSLLKEDISSLEINRFSLNDQVIRFQGQTTSVTEFDQMQEALHRLYPAASYRINTSEKSRGSGSVEFSTTIQQKQKR